MMKKYFLVGLLALLLGAVPTALNAQCPAGVQQLPLKVVTTDGYGDGWSGNQLLIYQDGTLLAAIEHPDYHYDDQPTTWEYSVCAGSTIEFKVSIGGWPDEAFFRISTIDGELLYDNFGNYSQDDVVATYEVPANVCFPAANITVSEATASSITLTWDNTYSGSDATYEVSVADGGVQKTVSATGTGVTIDGLPSNTLFNLGVVTTCGNGDMANIVNIDAWTDCEVYTLPVTLDFSQFAAQSGTNTDNLQDEVPNCWTRFGSGKMMVYQDASRFGGDKGLYLLNNAIAAMPEMELPAEGVSVTIDGEFLNKSSYYNLAVGYVDAMGNFTGCDVVEATETLPKTMFVNGYPQGARLAFQGSNYTYVMIKSIHVDEVKEKSYVTTLASTCIDENHTTYHWSAEHRDIDLGEYLTSGDLTKAFMGDTNSSVVNILRLKINHPTYDTLDAVEACDSYAFGGETLTESGLYSALTGEVNAAGCDIYETLPLTILESASSELELAACDSLVWNGETLTESGLYTYTTTAANGCDSVATLTLTVNRYQVRDTAVLACTSFTWNEGNGETYDFDKSTMTLGTEMKHIGRYVSETEHGCPDTLWLNLTFVGNQYKTDYLTVKGQYTDAQGNTYTNNQQDENLTITVKSEKESTEAPYCMIYTDSIITILPYGTEHYYVTTDQPYTWSKNGMTYKESGEYYKADKLASGEAGNIHVLHLYIVDGYAPLCAGDEVTVKYHNADGEQELFLGTLNVLNNTAAYEETYAYNVDYYTYFQYNFTFQSKHTADSTLYLCESELPYGLTLGQESFSFAADGDSYTYTLKTTEGCDSLLTITSSVLTTDTTTLDVAACDSYIWGIDSALERNYTQSGTDSYIYSYYDEKASCPKEVTVLNLTVNNSKQTAVDSTVLADQYGEYYFEADGNYYINDDHTAEAQPVVEETEVVYSSVAGCDSTVAYTLTINPYFDYDDVHVSSNGSLVWDGQLYQINEGEQYSEYGPFDRQHESGNGVVHNYVKVGTTLYLAENYLSECGTFTWERNGRTYLCLTAEEAQADASRLYKYINDNEETVYVTAPETYYDANDEFDANNGFAVMYTLNLVLNRAEVIEVVKNDYPLSLGSFYVEEADETFYYDEPGTYTESYELQPIDPTACKTIVNLTLNVYDNNYYTIDTVCAETESYSWNYDGVEVATLDVPFNGSSVQLKADAEQSEYEQFIAAIRTLHEDYIVVKSQGTEQEKVYHLDLYQTPNAYRTENVVALDGYTWRDGEKYTIASGKTTGSTIVDSDPEFRGCTISYLLNIELIEQDATTYANTFGTDDNGVRKQTYLWAETGEEYPNSESTIIEDNDEVTIYRNTVSYDTITTTGEVVNRHLELSVYKPVVKEESYTFCDEFGATVTRGNNTFSYEAPEGQAYIYAGAENSDVRDTIVNVTVSYNSIAVTNDTLYLCGVESYEWNGMELTASGRYRYDFTNEQTGCANVALLDLFLFEPEELDYFCAERLLPFEVNIHGTDCSFTESGEYKVMWSDEDGYGVRYSIVTFTVVPEEHLAYTQTVCFNTPVHFEKNYFFTTDEGVRFTPAETYDSLFAEVGPHSSEVDGYVVEYSEQYGYYYIDRFATLTLNVTVLDTTHNVTVDVVSCEPYTWEYDDYTYTSDTTVTYPSYDQYGCPNTITLNYKLGDETIINENIVACGSYVLDGEIYTESQDIVVNETADADLCPRTHIYHLTINHPVADTIEQVACGGYEWHGAYYTQSGSYVYTTQGVNGCDSIVTLILTVNQPVATEEEATACGSYEWNGQTYTQSGDYTFTTTAANGCDSVVTLHLTIKQPVSTTLAETACSSYEYDGNVLTESGIYTYTYEAANGCDSVVTLYLTILEPTTTTQSVTACGSYVWNGETYTESGTYTVETPATSGCPSVMTLELTINQPTTEALEATACGSYEWHGVAYTQSGIYTYTSTNADGCDHVQTLTLTINQPSTNTETASACESYTWELSGETYTESGVYTYTTTDDNGCDLVNTLVLTVNQPTSTEMSATACGSYEWNGTTYTESGTYTATSTAANGCENKMTLNLTINQPTTEALTATACGSYEWHGVVYTQSGIYTYTSTNADGCDHVQTLTLTINQPSTTTVSETACGSYTWELSGETYTESGIYTYTSTAANGCDAITTLMLTINQPVSYTLNVTAEGSYEWNGETYTESGLYTFHGTATNGCDSTVILNLTITQPEEQTYTVTVTTNIAGAGTITGAGEYKAGETVTLTATANDGYVFDGWSNGETTATITFVANSNITLSALFHEKVGIDDVDAAQVSISTEGTRIIVDGAQGSTVYIFDINGRMLRHEAVEGSTATFEMQTTGVYLVKVGNLPAKRVVIVR